MILLRCIINGIMTPNSILIACIALQIIGGMTQSHYGDEFYFGMPHNLIECRQVILDIAAVVTGSYNLTIPFLNKIETGDILENNLTSIKLPCTITRVGTFTDDRGIYLTTTVQVAVYATNYYENSAGSFLILPTKQLGRIYYPAAYMPTDSSQESYIMIAALEPPAHVSIYNNSRGRFEKNFTINEPQVSQYSNKSDLRDISVISDKPVSVISGTSCVDIPVGVAACDTITEQMIPFESLDTIYIAPPTPPKEAYELRIVNLASADNKTVCVYNKTSTICSNDSTISTRMGDEPTVIVSPHPVAVYQYGFGNLYPKSGIGDPFMTTIPGLSQFLNQYYFAIPDVYKNAQNRISIIITKHSVQGLILDGGTIASDNAQLFNVSNPFPNYTVLILNVTSGFHLLSHKDNRVKFGLLVYGFSAVSGECFGYGYPGGMQLSAINTSNNMTVNSNMTSPSTSVNSNLTTPNVPVTVNDEITSSRAINAEMTSLSPDNSSMVSRNTLNSSMTTIMMSSNSSVYSSRTNNTVSGNVGVTTVTPDNSSMVSRNTLNSSMTTIMMSSNSSVNSSRTTNTVSGNVGVTTVTPDNSSRILTNTIVNSSMTTISTSPKSPDNVTNTTEERGNASLRASENKSDSLGVILGSVFGAVIAMSTIACTVFLLLWRKKKKSEVEPEDKENVEELTKE